VFVDYFFTEQQQMIIDTAREITNEKIIPVRAELDEKNQFPREILQDIAKADLFSIFVPEEYGGFGGGCFEIVLAMEELARGCVGVATSFAASALGIFPVMIAGSEAQKQKYLPDIASGARWAAFGLTEANAGSDASGIRTTAVEDGEEWVLNGTKQWITNGGESQIYTIIALTDPHKGARGASIFVVEDGDPGFSYGKKEDKMGIRSSATRELILKDCRIPKDRLVGKRGTGFITVMKTLDISRPGIASLAIGLGQAALDEAVTYAKAACPVRQTDHFFPGRTAHSGRHGHSTRGRSSLGLCCRKTHR
jgi:alkylation response protein AidB-like acyl-CoA dehydrogenase